MDPSAKAKMTAAADKYEALALQIKRSPLNDDQLSFCGPDLHLPA
jgi:hypothetical protein